jgi:hypothetical protein
MSNQLVLRNVTAAYLKQFTPLQLRFAAHVCALGEYPSQETIQYMISYGSRYVTEDSLYLMNHARTTEGRTKTIHFTGI